MSQQELLKKVIRALESAGVEYMVSGSIASSLQGEPRLTHDIDLVVAIQEPKVGLLVSSFPAPDYYLDADTILDAIKQKRVFNLIDVNSGDKVDFWILTDEPFDVSRFKRKYAQEVAGIKIVVSSPEDTILMKLRWAKLSEGSEKQFVDALRVYEVQFEKLDIDYLKEWSKRLGINALFKKIQEQAEILRL